MAQITLAKSVAPSAPSVGTVTIYAKPDGNLYLKDDTGDESQIGASAASGTVWGDITGTVSDQTDLTPAAIGAATAAQGAKADTALQLADMTDYAKKSEANIFTQKQTLNSGIEVSGTVKEVPVVANSGASYTITDKSLHFITLTDNCTFTFPAPVAGLQFTIALKQDATGSRAVTWPSTARFAANTNPTLTTTANMTDVVSFFANGTYWLGFANGLNYSL